MQVDKGHTAHRKEFLHLGGIAVLFCFCTLLGNCGQLCRRVKTLVGKKRRSTGFALAELVHIVRLPREEYTGSVHTWRESHSQQCSAN